MGVQNIIVPFLCNSRVILNTRKSEGFEVSFIEKRALSSINVTSSVL